MGRMIFINLPVADLATARGFYAAVGAVNEPRFTDDTAACMTLSEHIHVMLLTHAKFASFSPRPIPSRDTAEVLLCLSADSRDEVDRLCEAAWNAGGRLDPIATQDYGFMYGRSFEDPDGHIWEVMWMDPAAVEKGPEAFAAAQMETA
jgi:predicted lactoylglutathione lyase